MTTSTSLKTDVPNARGSEAHSAGQAVLERLAPKNLLFLTDFSSASEAALPYAMAVASLHGSKLYVAHAVPPELLPPLLSQDLHDATVDAAWHQTLEQLRDISVRAPEISTQVLLRQGELGEVFSDMVDSNDIDLAVLGTRGGSGSWIHLLNSVAEQVYRRAPLSALLVGPRVARKKAGEVEFRRIVCAVDFIPEAEHALAYALLLAREQTLSVVHVLKGACGVSPQGQADVRDALKEQLLELGLGRRGRLPEFVVECGHPAEKILEAAEARHADLVVLGLRRRNDLAGSFAGLLEATALQVVSQARSPVLCVVSRLA